MKSTDNPEVWVADQPVVQVDRQTVKALTQAASGTKRERTRLCAHPNVDDKLHEMIIVHSEGAYVRPHKHPGKSESFHIIEGDVDIVLFTDAGEITDVIHMGDYASGKTFYWRLSEAQYHMVIVRSPTVVFHEVTNGPFNRETDFIPAPWSPDEEADPTAARVYLRAMDAVLAQWEFANRG